MDTPKYPRYVVVDTLDGSVFSHDEDGYLFSGEDAGLIAWEANYDRLPGHKTYHVFTLTPEQTNTYDGPRILE